MVSIILQICLMLEFLKKLHKLAQEKNTCKIIIETYSALMKVPHLLKESKVDKIGNQHQNHHWDHLKYSVKMQQVQDKDLLITKMDIRINSDQHETQEQGTLAFKIKIMSYLKN